MDETLKIKNAGTRFYEDFDRTNVASDVTVQIPVAIAQEILKIRKRMAGLDTWEADEDPIAHVEITIINCPCTFSTEPKIPQISDVTIRIQSCGFGFDVRGIDDKGKYYFECENMIDFKDLELMLTDKKHNTSVEKVIQDIRDGEITSEEEMLDGLKKADDKFHDSMEELQDK